MTMTDKTLHQESQFRGKDRLVCIDCQKSRKKCKCPDEPNKFHFVKFKEIGWVN